MSEHQLDYSDAMDRVTADADEEVWVVEAKRGGEWRVSAVLTSFEDANQYEEDLRAAMNQYPEEFPEDLKQDDIRTRHGGRQSPVKLFREWPPEV